MQGRQAGKKVVVIKQLDEGTKERPYPHAIVAGIERYPRKVTRRMGAKKLQSRSKVKPFIKVCHVLSRTSFECDNKKWRMEGCQLLSSVPDTLRTGAREFEGRSDIGYFQGAITTRGCEENDKEDVRGEVHRRQEQVVLYTSEGMSFDWDRMIWVDADTTLSSYSSEQVIAYALCDQNRP